MNRNVTCLLLGLLGWPPLLWSQGRVVRLDSLPSQYVAPRHIDIWLPPGYDTDTRQHYPVLYMHDGQNLFFPGAAFGGKAWEVDEVMCRLLAADSVRPCIVVGIWNTALRFVEYAPAAPFGLMSPEWQAAVRAERMQASPLSDAYLKFLVQELKPYVDQHYRTRPGRAHTFIMGSSMGGLISLYAQMEYPEVFGGAACISTHWPLSLKENRGDFTQAMVQYLKVHLPQRRVPRLYFDYGTTTLDAWYEPHQLLIDSLLRADYPATKWITHKFEGAAHQESSWQARLHIPLVFLLGK